MINSTRNVFRSRLLGLLKPIFAPKTPERLVGSIQIVLGLLFLAFRPPTPATLAVLQTVYGLVVTTMGIGLAWIVFGLILFWKKRVGRKTFLVLFAPTCLYAVCVVLLVVQTTPAALPLAFMSVGFCYFVLRDYGQRAAERENNQP